MAYNSREKAICVNHSTVITETGFGLQHRTRAIAPWTAAAVAATAATTKPNRKTFKNLIKLHHTAHYGNWCVKFCANKTSINWRSGSTPTEGLPKDKPLPVLVASKNHSLVDSSLTLPSRLAHTARLTVALSVALVGGMPDANSEQATN